MNNTERLKAFQILSVLAWLLILGDCCLRSKDGGDFILKRTAFFPRRKEVAAYRAAMIDRAFDDAQQSDLVKHLNDDEIVSLSLPIRTLKRFRVHLKNSIA